MMIFLWDTFYSCQLELIVGRAGSKMQHRSLGSTGADFGRLYTILDFLSSNVYSLINVKIKVDIVAFSATHTDSQLL